MRGIPPLRSRRGSRRRRPVKLRADKGFAGLELPDEAGLMAAPMAADTARHYDRATEVRDQQRVSRRPDL